MRTITNRLIMVAFALAGSLLASTLLTGCHKEESDSLTFNLDGSWVIDQINGQQLLTNDQIVYKTGSSSTIAECFRDGYNETNSQWVVYNLQYAVWPGKMMLNYPEANRSFEFEVEQPSENEMHWQLLTSNDNGDVSHPNIAYHLRRLHKDYSTLLLGTWEEKCITPGEPDEVHRWRYLPDGSYAYLSRNEQGNWDEKADNGGTYTLYGDLLVTSWYNDAGTGTKGKNCELWNLTIAEGKMSWQATRKEGKTIEFAMAKVDK